MLRKTFIQGKINKDLDNRIIGDGDYRDALNIEVIDSEDSDVGAIENALSNKKLTDIDFGPNPRNRGKYCDESKDKIYWWQKSDTGCFLLEWDNKNQVVSIVLQDTRTENVDRVLNLSDDRDHYITGAVKVITEKEDKDLLLWTDNNMEICCINIERAKTWGENNFTEEDLYLVMPQPKQAPTVIPTYSGDESNYLEEEIISFGYRYKDADGKRSAISTYANYAFSPKRFEMDFQTMENAGMVNAFNAVKISFDTGRPQVTDIEIVSKKSNSNELNLIARFNKNEEGWSDNEARDFIFSNNKKYATIPEKELLRTFDNVPLKAKALELIENILVVGNYVEGYDIIDADGNSIKIDYSVGYTSSSVAGTELSVNNNGSSIVISIPSNIELEKNQTLSFDINMSNLENAGSWSDFVEFVLPDNFDNASELAQNADFVFFIEQLLTNKFIADYTITPPSGWNFTGNTNFQIAASLTSITLFAIELNFDNGGTNEVVPFLFQDSTEIAYNTLNPFASVKSNKDNEIGLIYQDKWGRKSTVLVSTNNTIHIPNKKSTFRNRLLININNPAPYWADSYKVVVKSAPLQYNNIIVNQFYTDGIFRWVKLEGANLDKVSEGDTLIVKSDLTGPVNEVVKTRVIELVQKEADFLSGNVDGNDVEIVEEAGLYMKIKPTDFDMNFDNSSTFLSYDHFDSNNSGLPSVNIGNKSSLAGYLNATSGNYVDYVIPVGSKVNVKFRNYENDFERTYEKEFVVQSEYTDFQSWWEAEVIDLGVSEGDFDVSFVRDSGNNQLVMNVIGREDGTFFQHSKLSCQIDIILVQGFVMFETIPVRADVDTFYETQQTFDIENGLHKGSEQDQTNSLPAIIELDFFNCYAQGNGLESYQVKDSLNTNYLNIDLKPTSTSIEPYRQFRRFADLTYSEFFVEETNFNGLNVFNLSQINFKSLDKQYSSIQMLWSRDTNIVVLQEEKAGYVLFGKDLLTMSSGQPLVSNSLEILGQYVPFIGENGIGTNPESFDSDAYRAYYVNPRRGTPIRLSRDGTSEINYGLVDFFRDMFINSPTSFKHGGFDPYHKKYVVSAEDEVEEIQSINCGQTILKTLDSVFEYELQLSEIPGDVDLSYFTEGTINIQVDLNGTITTQNNLTGNGTFTFSRTNTTIETATVTITPVTTSPQVKVVNTCPIGIAAKIVSIIIGDVGDVGSTITTRFKVNNGAFYPTAHLFDQVGVDEFLSETGIEGIGKLPKNGDSIIIQAFKDINNSGEFDTAKENTLSYLVSTAEYTEADINTILSLSTDLTTTKTQLSETSYIEEGGFVFNKPSSNSILYLIWNFEDVEVTANDDSIDIYNGGSEQINVLFNDIYTGTPAISILSQPNYGSVTVNANNTITYNHGGLNILPDSFQYKIDNGGSSDTATVSINVSNAPVIGGGNGTSTIFSISSLGHDPLLTSNGQPACDFVTDTQKYHDGNTSVPTLADFVFDDFAKTTPFNGQNRYYSIVGGRTIQISSTGLITDVWICGQDGGGGNA